MIITDEQAAECFKRIAWKGSTDAKDIFNDIFKLVRYNYYRQVKDFAENPSEDHILLTITRLKHDLFSHIPIDQE